MAVEPKFDRGPDFGNLISWRISAVPLPHAEPRPRGSGTWEAVESVPGKVSGAWVLRGTRMPVSAIFENLQAGANIDDIMEWFDGLDREQVKAVIEFAVRSLDKMPALMP